LIAANTNEREACQENRSLGATFATRDWRPVSEALALALALEQPEHVAGGWHSSAVLDIFRQRLRNAKFGPW
jgi:hypothetical protein